MSAMPQPQYQPPDDPQLKVVEPPPPTKHSVRVGPILRDVAIVWVLTAIGGFVAGFAARDPKQAMLAIVVSNFLLGTVAFTIAGCLAPSPRWRHLGFVALGAWLTSLINVVFFHVTIAQWFGGIVFMAVIMSVGGALSYIFKRDAR